MTVLIAVPVGGCIECDCVAGLFEAQKYFGDCDFLPLSRYDCARARNIIAKNAISGGYSHVLMVDSDIVLPPDCIGNLLEPAVDIVLGFYRRKDDSGKFEMFSEGHGWNMLGDSDLEGAPNRIQVKGGGFGCAMVDVKVFSKLRFPWFVYEQREDGSILSEDLHFARIASNSNMRIWADTRVMCGHVGKKTWW